jgi:hypothetical protein
MSRVRDALRFQQRRGLPSVATNSARFHSAAAAGLEDQSLGARVSSKGIGQDSNLLGGQLFTHAKPFASALSRGQLTIVFPPRRRSTMPHLTSLSLVATLHMQEFRLPRLPSGIQCLFFPELVEIDSTP